MSLPPTTVQIKRKRTDEPVEFLRIQETNGKRQRTIEGYIFERQVPSTPIGDPPARSSLLNPRPIKPLHRSGSSRNIAAKNLQSNLQSQGLQASHTEAEDSRLEAHQDGISASRGPVDKNVAVDSISETNIEAPVRRFHISRNVHEHDPENTSQLRKVRKEIPIVFVERRLRPRLPNELSTKAFATSVSPNPDINLYSQKKPGKNARTAAFRSAEAKIDVDRKPDIPSGLRNRWDVSTDELAKEMEAYTLQAIGYQLNQQDNATTSPVDTRSGQGLSKFKPKVPAQRYTERHPEMKTLKNSGPDIDYEVVSEELDGEDFVTETYVRVSLDGSGMRYANVGLLVLDSQPDINEFYGESEDSDEDEEYEEEDENAENHYSADYPDEEVDSDDEYGRNAYTYRNNASDDEFNSAYSDSEDEGTKEPWRHRP